MPGGGCPSRPIATEDTWPTSHVPSQALRIFTAPDPICTAGDSSATIGRGAQIGRSGASRSIGSGT